jgi:hypothetical protein
MVVTFVQFLRLRDAKLAALVGLFATQAFAFSRDWRDPLQNVFQIASGGFGLVLLMLVSRRTGKRL